MILPWRICFSALLVAFCAAIGAHGQATVKGRVMLADSSKGGGRARGDYSDVAVWLDAPMSDAPLHLVHKRAVMLQKDKRFTPHVLIVECGTNIDFPNKDPIFHNAFSNFDGQTFDIGLYPPGTSRTVRFDRPGIVRVFCNIHSTMSAVIVTVNSPYFAITEADGSFVIRNVEPGEYSVHFFHERALPETLDHLTRPLTVNADNVNLATVSISEAGYLPSAHKNKYGKNYPADHNASTTYSGIDR